MLRRLFGSRRSTQAEAGVARGREAAAFWLYGHRSSLFMLFASALVRAPGARVKGIVGAGPEEGLASADFEGCVVPFVGADVLAGRAGDGVLVDMLDAPADRAALDALAASTGLPVIDLLEALAMCGCPHTYMPMDVEREYALGAAAQFGRVRGRLGDAWSRRVLDARIAALVDFDRRALLAERCAVDVEYFNATDPCASLVPGAGGVYVDVGAAHGDTVDRYRRAVGDDFAAIHAFEPTRGQFAALAAACAGDARIHLHCAAVGETPGDIPFFDNAAEPFGSNALTLDRATEGATVPCVRLDDLIDSCTLIKIDVEGFECAVLRGAARLVRAHAPDLAVACYHYPADLVEIVAAVDALHRYRHVALRHYGPSLFDSVLLFSDRQEFGSPG